MRHTSLGAKAVVWTLFDPAFDETGCGTWPKKGLRGEVGRLWTSIRKRAVEVKPPGQFVGKFAGLTNLCDALHSNR